MVKFYYSGRTKNRIEPSASNHMVNNPMLMPTISSVEIEQIQCELSIIPCLLKLILNYVEFWIPWLDYSCSIYLNMFLIEIFLAYTNTITEWKLWCVLFVCRLIWTFTKYKPNFIISDINSENPIWRFHIYVDYQCLLRNSSLVKCIGDAYLSVALPRGSYG